MRNAILLLCAALIFAPTIINAQRKKKNVTTPVTIRFENVKKNNVPLDSVLVIFDRYDLTGAGVVKKIYYPVNNVVSIQDVPEGKYYINVLCLCAVKYLFTHEGFVYKGKNKVRFKLPKGEVFYPGTFLPEDYFNINTLAITSFYLRR